LFEVIQQVMMSSRKKSP